MSGCPAIGGRPDKGACADANGCAGGVRGMLEDSGMAVGSGAVWDGEGAGDGMGIAGSGVAGGCAFEVQEGVGGGAVVVRSSSASAEPAAGGPTTGAGSGETGPTE